MRFVMTHRDPRRSPSYTSLVSTIFPPAQTRICTPGPRSEHLQRAARHRGTARIGEDRFLDVHHRELVTDPKAPSAAT
jgi:hypothetical protein